MSREGEEEEEEGGWGRKIKLRQAICINKVGNRTAIGKNTESQEARQNKDSELNIYLGRGKLIFTKDDKSVKYGTEQRAWRPRVRLSRRSLQLKDRNGTGNAAPRVRFCPASLYFRQCLQIQVTLRKLWWREIPQVQFFPICPSVTDK